MLGALGSAAKTNNYKSTFVSSYVHTRIPLLIEASTVPYQLQQPFDLRIPPGEVGLKGVHTACNRLHMEQRALWYIAIIVAPTISLKPPPVCRSDINRLPWY